MHPVVEKISREQLRRGIPNFRPGDTLRVHCKIREGDKERVQIFEGVCLRRRRGATNATFTVFKRSFGVGVERVFPLNSPTIEKIEVASAGEVRRSRLYYLRKLTGKAARIAGRQWEGEYDQHIGEDEVVDGDTAHSHEEAPAAE